LLDGKRVPATNSDGTVDTNSLPQLLLKRVDIATGGASAVYGSDAVTGVVNFILDNKFNGVKANIQSGISQEGDAFSWRGGFAAGTDLFGGRGHFEASFEHYEQEGIGDKFKRPNGAALYAVEGSGTSANPFVLVSGARVAQSSFGGVIRSGPLAGTNFYENGLYRPFVQGAPSGSAGIQLGGDGTYVYGSSIMATLRTNQAFGRFDFDVTDDIHWYVQGSGATTYNLTNSGAANFFNYTLSAENAFLPGALRSQLAPGSTFSFSHTYSGFPIYQTQADAKSVAGTTGLTGKIGGFGKWDLFYTHGQTTQHIRALNNVNIGRVIAAYDAVDAGTFAGGAANGNIVCRVTLTNPGVYPGCVPLNPFGPTAFSSAAQNYVLRDTMNKSVNKLDDFGGSVAGSPFSTWAGPVQIAISGEYRKLSLETTTNADPRIRPNCTGLRYNCTANTLMYTFATVAPVQASQNIKEGAIEATVPLLRDVRFFKSLDLNGAYRHTNYSTSGGVNTWKIGGDWQVNDDISLRATRSRDIRAPNLFELFAPQALSITGFTDLHTNIAQQVTLSTAGNADLRPEIAQTFTAGIVLKPHFIPRFSFSADFYSIKISNAIASVGGTTALAQCEQSNGASPLCALFVRPLPFSDRSAANFPTMILTRSLNVANAKTKGVDFEANYSAPANFGDSPVFAGGRFNLRGLVSWQPVLDTQQFAGAPIIKSAGVTNTPEVRATALVDYSTDTWSLAFQDRWRSAVSWNGTPGLVYNIPKIAAANFLDATLTVHPAQSSKFEFFFSVQNLLNKTAPVYADVSAASSPNYYYPVLNGDDFIGRYFTSGVRIAF
jgi:outer membrane receptor protein involved in Fe transport